MQDYDFIPIPNDGTRGFAVKQLQSMGRKTNWITPKNLEPLNMMCFLDGLSTNRSCQLLFIMVMK